MLYVTFLRLQVPEIQIFNVWLRPYVVATVQVTEDGVIIEAQEAKIEGSPEVLPLSSLSVLCTVGRCR